MDWVFLGLYLSEFALKIFADRLAFFTDGWYTALYLLANGDPHLTLPLQLSPLFPEFSHLFPLARLIIIDV
jgi:hypothetical protein